MILAAGLRPMARSGGGYFPLILLLLVIIKGLIKSDLN
jgi:hypothetical protein